jgi:AraC-like DNA-binding protein
MSDPSSFVNSEEKENIVEIDGKQYVQLGEEYEQENKPYQPRRRYGEKTVRGVIVGRGENRQIIPVDEVRKLAALHCSYKDMAEYFQVNESTFRDHFRTEVERSRQKLKHRLLESMIENAITRMHPTMQIWLSRNWLGMDDNREQAQGESVLPWIEEDED